MCQEKLEKITGKKLEVQRPLVFQGVDSQLAIEIQSQLKPMGVEARRLGVERDPKSH